MSRLLLTLAAWVRGAHPWCMQQCDAPLHACAGAQLGGHQGLTLTSFGTASRRCDSYAAASKLTYVLTGFPDGGDTVQRPDSVLTGAGTAIAGQPTKVSAQSGGHAACTGAQLRACIITCWSNHMHMLARHDLQNCSDDSR